MTCVVALHHEGKVYLGADSSAVENGGISTRIEPKIFKKGKFLMGYCNSFRFGQVVEYYFNPPKSKSSNIMEYMVCQFVPELISVTKYHDVEENTSSLIIAYEGKIFYIDSDWQVGWDTTDYHAIGSGADVAMGSLYSTEGQQPLERLRIALEASEKFSTTVSRPFNYMTS